MYRVDLSVKKLGVRKNAQRGVTFVELLASLVLMGIVFAGVGTFFLDNVKQAYNQSIITGAEEEAKTVLDLMVYELRMMGNGMPMDQDNFLPGGAGLGDSPLALLTTSNQTSVTFRLSERGKSVPLVADYLPDPSNLTFQVFDAQDFSVGEEVYLSNMSRGGSEGLHGQVTSVAGGQIAIHASYITTVGASFETGSIASQVSTITYDSAGAGSGIDRTLGASTVTISPSASFSVDYLDENGIPVPLPLTESVIRDDITSIELTVIVEGTNQLKDGSVYSVQAQQRVALRNFNLEP